MAAPANIRNRLGQLLDAAWDARQAGTDYFESELFTPGGLEVIVIAGYRAPRQGRFHVLEFIVEWRQAA